MAELVDNLLWFTDVGFRAQTTAKIPNVYVES